MFFRQSIVVLFAVFTLSTLILNSAPSFATDRNECDVLLASDRELIEKITTAYTKLIKDAGSNLIQEDELLFMLQTNDFFTLSTEGGSLKSPIRDGLLDLGKLANQKIADKNSLKRELKKAVEEILLKNFSAQVKQVAQNEKQATVRSILMYEIDSGSEQAIQFLRFFPKEKLLVVANGAGDIKFFDQATRTMTYEHSFPSMKGIELAFDSEHPWIISVHNTKQGETYDLKLKDKVFSLQDLKLLTGLSVLPKAFAVNMEQHPIAIGSPQQSTFLWSSAFIWNSVTGSELFYTRRVIRKVQELALSKDAEFAAIGWTDGKIQIWSAEQNEIVQTISTRLKWIRTIEFSQDSHRLVVYSPKQIKIWDLATKGSVFSIQREELNTAIAALSSDNRYFVFRHKKTDDLEIWDVTQNKRLKTLTAPAEGISAIVFSPDSKLLGIGSYSGKVRVYDFEQLLNEM